MIGFDNWFTVENVFGNEFCFSDAEIINIVANGLRGELILELQVSEIWGLEMLKQQLVELFLQVVLV